jgi:DNA-binding NarL/FixJ family response regulator
MKTTVLLVDDHDLIRQGLRRALEQAGDFEVVGEASRLSEGSELLESQSPAVLIIDVRLPDGNGIELARAARKARPDL